MKHFILIGNFKPGRPEGPAFKAALDAHHAYNRTFLDKGDILTCGPKPGGGGVCIFRAESREAVDEYIANDPFVKAGVQEYTVTEFNIFAIQEYAQGWKTEG